MGDARARLAEPVDGRNLFEPPSFQRPAASRETLIRRVLQSRGMDYWESGMDLNLGEDFYDTHGGRGRDGRGLEDDCVACDERGRDLPDGDGDWKVPRRYDGDDAVRLLDRVCEVARKL